MQGLSHMHPARSDLDVKLYSTLLRIRPTQIGSLLKKCLFIRRRLIQTKTGHVFWADPVSYFGFQLLVEAVYEPQMTRLLQLVLRPSDVFVDVGANEGYFSVLAATLVGDGRVHSIEPQSRLQAVLKENIRLNACSSVIVHPVALADCPGKVQLFLRPSTNTGGSGLYRVGKIGLAREKVAATTLDLLFQQNGIERVRLLKIDCEGAEHIVVTGGEGVLRNRLVEFIAMEYHPTIGQDGRTKCTKTHETLSKWGYLLTNVNGQHIYHLPELNRVLEPLGKCRVGCHWAE